MENTTHKYSKLNRPIYAHKVISHLIDHGEITTVEMRDLLGISHDGFWYRDLLLYIWNKIMDLAEEWDEDIPPMTVLIFNKDGKLSPNGCAYYADAETQPTPEQIAEEKEFVDMYDKWDQVLNAFKADIPDKE